MATSRRALEPISPNITRGKDTHPYIRGRIEQAYADGHKSKGIMKLLKVSRGAVRSTLQNAHLRANGVSLPKSGMPKVYSIRDMRYLVRYIKKYPDDTYQQVRDAQGKKYSDSTIKRELRTHNIRNWRAAKRPELTDEHRAARLAWCILHRNWRREEWGLVMWSDECSVERGKGKKTKWVFRTPTQKWDHDMIETYKASKGMTVMVWGCFWDHGRSDLYIMDRDFESKKHGYSANSYIEVLDGQVEPWIEELDDPGYIFMQDNAPIHTAHKVRDWFADRGIIVMNWPPYSPDLNPIEHIWHLLKQMMVEIYPELSACKGKSEQDRENIGDALKACWAAIPKARFDALYQTMSHRIEACIAADGWQTKY